MAPPTEPRPPDWPSISDAELELMKWLWERGPTTVRALHRGRTEDGREWAYTTVQTMLARLEEKGMVLVFNPLERDVTRTLRLDLYYTGIEDTARIAASDRDPVEVQLARDHTVDLEVQVPARGFAWYVIR